MKAIPIFISGLLLLLCVTACDISHPDQANDPGATDSIDYPENNAATQSEMTYDVDSTTSTIGPDNAASMPDSMPAK